MTELRVRPEAEVDAYSAALWYEGEREGLGQVFFQALRDVFRRVEEMPLQFPAVKDDIRRAILPRFPFGVFFVVDSGVATVLAIMHLHRQPESWERRR
jgi:plasmid stabilization system protein ParE